MRNALVKFTTLCIITTCGDCVFGADRRVEIDVLIASNAPIEAAHEWLDVLKTANFDQVRIRNQQSADVAPAIKGNSSPSRTVLVTAVLRADNKLLVPGASFRRQDSADISAWLKKLRNPPPLDTSSTTASPEQLLRLRNRLSSPLTAVTKGVPILKLLAATKDWDVTISVDPSVRFQSNDEISLELSPLTQGTSLAIAAREYGAVLVPSPDGNSLVITTIGNSEQSWPIGWKLQKPLPRTVPKLVESLNVEIKDTPLADVLNAIQSKVAIPFVIDRLELDRKQIDLKKIKVNIRPRRAMYKKVLDSILVRNLLVGEVRVDEAGKPFYWITTLQLDRK